MHNCGIEFALEEPEGIRELQRVVVDELADYNGAAPNDVANSTRQGTLTSAAKSMP
jgi:hypothetical protein